MITRRGNKPQLTVFDNFQIDRGLPKYAGEEKEDVNGNLVWTIPTAVTNVGTNGLTFNDSTTGTVWVNQSVPANPSEGWSISVDGGNEKLTLKNRLKIAFTLKSRMKKLESKRKKENLITIRDYFLNLSQHFSELSPLADVADHYEKAIVQANQLGQTSLVENLKEMLEVVRGEAHLIQMGLKHYVTEAQMCDFYEGIDEDKNLKLTWIKNFVKIIPKDVVDIKSNVDERGVFDNYVILHFDPNNDATDLTQEEKEVKKDPILFGVISNSKKLYYIADWVDDYCDLTLEKMFEELGEKTLEINGQSLKTYINKVGKHEARRKKIKSK